MTRTSTLIAGTRNSNGAENRNQIETLLAVDFDFSEIICFEGLQRTINVKTAATVDSVSLR